MSTPEGYRFYRVVRTNPPTLADFRSLKELGRQLRSDTPADVVRLFDGMSVSSTRDGALYTAHRIHNQGKFIAVLDVPLDGPFRVEQTTD